MLTTLMVMVSRSSLLERQKLAAVPTLASSLMKRQNTFNLSLKQFPLVLRNADYRTGQPCNPCASGESSKLNVTYVPYKKKTYKDHDHKNMTLNRPMSPHLDIYGPTLPAMTSIGQRATGIGMTMFAVFLSGITLGLPNGVDTFIDYVQKLNLPEAVIIGGKTVIAFVFTFHYFIGLRFVGFTLGKLLDLKVAYTSAYISLVLAAVTSVLCALIGHGYSFSK